MRFTPYTDFLKLRDRPRTHYVVANRGEIDTWLDLTVIEGEDEDTIVQIDWYLDEACEKLLVDDDHMEAHDADTQKRIFILLRNAQFAKQDAEIFAAKVARWQEMTP